MLEQKLFNLYCMGFYDTKFGANIFSIDSLILHCKVWY